MADWPAQPAILILFSFFVEKSFNNLKSFNLPGWVAGWLGGWLASPASYFKNFMSFKSFKILKSFNLPGWVAGWLAGPPSKLF